MKVRLYLSGGQTMDITCDKFRTTANPDGGFASFQADGVTSGYFAVDLNHLIAWERIE